MRQNETQNRNEDLVEVNYEEYETILFSISSSIKELEEVCMTLAHLPTKRAQDLLARFKETNRAREVTWLDCAIDEGRGWYLDPQNNLEERDYLALKMMQEIEDELVELEIELNDARLDLEKLEIEHYAIRELVKNRSINKDEGVALHDVKIFYESKFEKLQEKIDLKQKIVNQIKESIKTERYKDLDPMVMKNVHFT